jgi:hypothetical protein
MALLILLAVVVLIDLLALAFGADSRDHRRADHPLVRDAAAG